VSLDGYPNRHLVHRNLSPEMTEATFGAMEYIHSIRNRDEMALYNSYTLMQTPDGFNNVDDLDACIARQIGSVDSIHVQNDFLTFSHREFDFDHTKQILQRVMEKYSGSIRIFYNAGLVSYFDIRTPYERCLPWREEKFSKCYVGLLNPTVECGSNMVWPCCRYHGAAKPEDQKDFDTMFERMEEMRSAPDHKGLIDCPVCVNASFNETMDRIASMLERDKNAKFFLFYPVT